jgi:hypothetical protein
VVRIVRATSPYCGKTLSLAVVGVAQPPSESLSVGVVPLSPLVKQVPQPHLRHYQRIWNGEVKGKVREVRGLVAQLTDASNEWQYLDDVG